MDLKSEDEKSRMLLILLVSRGMDNINTSN